MACCNCTKITRKYKSTTTSEAGLGTTITITEGTETNDTCENLECPKGATKDCKKVCETKSKYQTTSSTSSAKQKKIPGADPGSFKWKSSTVTDYDETVECWQCTCSDGTEPKPKEEKK